MIFSKKKLVNCTPLVIKSGYSYASINKVDKTKFLGVYINDDMTFKTHIAFLSQKLARIAALIYQVKDLMPEFVLKNMYYAHAQSLLFYCNLIWNNTNKSDLNSLYVVQKRLIRLITKSEYLAHTRPLFRRTKILDLESIRKYCLGLYCYKNKDNFDHLLATHTYSTRHRYQLRPIRHRTSKFEKSFIYQAPILWNQIRTQINDINNFNSLQIFKRNYKKILISNI